jgi:perosamine synthetase
VDGVAAGQVRLDWREAGEAELSLYLLEEFTGRGLGGRAIQQACQRARLSGRATRVLAAVRKSNRRSVAAFRRAGFVPDDRRAARRGHLWLANELFPPVPHNRLTFGPEEEAAVAAVVRSGQWAGGRELARLEANFAGTAKVSGAIGVGSGVAALRLSLRALGIGPGDAVAVPGYSCVALANAVLACGAEPVALEVDPVTHNLAVPALRAALAARKAIKAAIAVHTFGAVAPVTELAALGLPVIEDCSHAFGRGRLGALGRIAVLSLHATKLMGAGEGGMVLTDDAALAERVRAARDYTDRAPAAWRLNDKLSDLAAALARCQLDRLPDLLARRETLAARYATLLAPSAGAGWVLPERSPGRVWYRYAVAVPGDAAAIVARMADDGVTAARPVERWADDLPSACAAAFHRLVSLPLYPTLGAGEQDRVVRSFLAAVASLPA